MVASIKKCLKPPEILRSTTMVFITFPEEASKGAKKAFLFYKNLEFSTKLEIRAIRGTFREKM